MTKLSVNINKFATIRNSRGGNNPDVVKAAVDAQRFGADGVTVHPRPDERHIRYQDVYDLKPLLKTEFNIEGNPKIQKFVDLVLDVKPEQVTLVPDGDNQITSDHGWNIGAHRGFLTDVVGRLKAGGMRVSLFVDPEPDLPFLAREVGADRVEIYTGPYGGAFVPDEKRRELDKVVSTGIAAAEAGVGLNAGHDLTRDNLPPIIEALPWILEVSIGHAITADALEFGMAEAVRRFRIACGNPS